MLTAALVHAALGAQAPWILQEGEPSFAAPDGSRLYVPWNLLPGDQDEDLGEPRFVTDAEGRQR